MGLDDRTGNREAKAHAARFGREEWLEDIGERPGCDARPIVAHGNFDEAPTVESCGHTDAETSSVCPIERVHSIQYQVEQHLL